MRPTLLRHLIALSCASILLAVVYLIIYRHQSSDAHMAMSSDTPELEWLRQEFDVPDEKFGKILSLHQAFDMTCHRMCRELAESQDALHRTVSESTEFSPEVEAAMAHTSALRERCRRATLQHMYEVSALMTPEQAERYREIISQRVVIAGRLPHLDEYGTLEHKAMLQGNSETSSEATPHE